jgi:hypothetical protein
MVCPFLALVGQVDVIWSFSGSIFENVEEIAAIFGKHFLSSGIISPVNDKFTLFWP